MPLRKKHVRYTVFALVTAGVPALLAALVLYGVHVRSGGYGRAIEEALASRLRCEATVHRARPTGLSTAAADAVHLAWTAAGGRLTLDLHRVDAVRNPDGRSWTVRAEEGRLALAGDDPGATLAAVNQRLVQVRADVPPTPVSVRRLHAALALGPVHVASEVRLVLAPARGGLEARLFAPASADHPADMRDVAGTARPLAVMRLDPRGERGVFAGFHAHLSAETGVVRHALGMKPRDKQAKPAGCLDLTINWFWPEADADAATVSARATDMELAGWTENLPGGSLAGTGTLQVHYWRDVDGSERLSGCLSAPGGSVRGKTLGWLTALPAPLAGWKEPPPGDLPFDRLAVAFEVTGKTGRFVGEMDRWGGIPVLTVRLLGYDVPLLWVRPETFNAAALWQAVRAGLDLGQPTP